MARTLLKYFEVLDILPLPPPKKKENKNWGRKNRKWGTKVCEKISWGWVSEAQPWIRRAENDKNQSCSKLGKMVRKLVESDF